MMSSTLSPRLWEPSEAAICDGVTSPESVASNAHRFAPGELSAAATLAIKGLKNSVAGSPSARAARMKAAAKSGSIAQDQTSVARDAFGIELHAVYRAVTIPPP